MSARDHILKRLNDEANGITLPEPFAFEDSIGKLIEVFTTRLLELGVVVIESAQISSLKLGLTLLDNDVSHDLLSWHPETTFVSPDHGSVWKVDTGVTRAELGIAESGSLLLLQNKKSRLLSLCPPRHLVVLSKDNLVARLEDALPMLGDHNAVLISGPSRTADIEGILVKGVHGPSEVFVVLI